MSALVIGAVLAIIMGVAARITHFDIDRSYYATVLIVIASYYVLFAFMAQEAIIIEIVIASIFAAIAVFGAYRWAPLIGIGIILHGVFDLTHSHLIHNSGVPSWWPAFCAGVDLVLGIWVIYLAITNKVLTARGGAT